MEQQNQTSLLKIFLGVIRGSRKAKKRGTPNVLGLKAEGKAPAHRPGYYGGQLGKK